MNLLYLMVLADSHTLSKSIDNDEKVDAIFESINDVDQPTIPKTKKDQHNCKLYCSKDDGVLQGIKITKPYSEVEKATDKITVKPAHKPTTENAKRHKSPKRRVNSFWKKLRGKDKKKETEKHDSKIRRSNHKKESHKIAYLTTKPVPGKTEPKKKHRKKLHLRQSEHKLSKRDGSGLFSTTPYSNTPQSYKLQMEIAPQVDNMLKSIKIKPVQPHTVAVATIPEVSDNLQAQLERINFYLSKLKKEYGLAGHIAKSASNNNPSATSTQGNITTTKYQGTAQIDDMLRAMKVKAVSMMSCQTSSVTELSNDASEATIDSNQRTRVSAFNTLVSENEIANGEKRTVARTGTYALNPKDSTINANTESHYQVARSIKEDAMTIAMNVGNDREKRTVARTGTYALNPKDSTFNANTESHYQVARSIKDDAMTIAMNVEDIIQKELKSLYHKLKHKVSKDLQKEVHTASSTLKDSYEKVSGKHKAKSKTSNTTKSKHPSSITSSPEHKTSPYKDMPKIKVKVVQSTIPARTFTSTTTRVKKKDKKEGDTVDDSFFTPEAYGKQTEKEGDRVEDSSLTPEAYGKQTYDDYGMLTLYEQMLSKKHESNARKLLATPEFAIYAKNKREARRLSKRNPETLTDVKLTEVVRNIYDDGGNMPDYDDIDPAANVSSTGRTTVRSYNYNNDYVIYDSSSSADYSSQGSKPLESKPIPKGTSPLPKDHCNNSATVANNTATSGIPISATSFAGLSNKISYNQFVDGYKHYLKFQQELKNQNFSNLVKYQAHRHHSVDDIGKYILNKIPPLPTFNRRKRKLRFSGDSDNNMDYQEITSKSDDSWFKKHFYLFIDNGPPKKYHTSETVELKPGSVDYLLYFTDKTSTTRENLVRIDSQSAPRKTKNEISLNDLSKILDSIKFQGTNTPSTKATPPETQKEDTFMDTYNAADDATTQDSSFIGKFLSGKRRRASKKRPVTTMYFPTTNYMYADNHQDRFKRSNKQENFENTVMADFMNKDIKEEKAATAGTKRVFSNAAQTSNRETNKYGYVDIDLVPRQTAVVKLRNNTKKSRIKNFFNKFHFKKDKTKKSKPKRSAYYNYYLPSTRRERFNPIKKLKNIFKKKERYEIKNEPAAPASPLHVDYDVNTEDIATLSDMEEPKFKKPMMDVAEMQKQIPNITDTYEDSEPLAIEHTTEKNVADHYKLDDIDQYLLLLNHLESSSTKPILMSQTRSAKRIMITEPVVAKAKQALVAIVSLMPSSTITATPKLQKVPPSNVITVNIKTMEPTTSKTTEITSPLTIDDMSVILKQMHKELGTSSEYYPAITKMYDYDSSTDRFNLPLPQELSIKSKLIRYVKFPIRNRRYKMKRGDDSEPDDIMREYLHDLESSSTVPSEKRKAVVNTSKKVHPHTYKPNKKEKSPYTDYFNDLLTWDSDILNLDSVTNPVWMNILNSSQSESTTSYTTPDMRHLMTEWNEMNDFLENQVNSDNSAVTIPTGSTGVKAKDHVSVRTLENQLDDDEEGVIRSMAMDDNTVVTSKDVLIKGEAKYFQYNKPKSSDARASSNVVWKLNTLNNGDNKKKEKLKMKRKEPRTGYLTPADIPAVAPILFDTTFIAYDDDVDSIAKELEVKKPCKGKNSKRSGKVPPPVAKTEHNTVLKTNKAPVQYYTTPLPMKSQDFHKFLKDYQMDVEYVTAPILELPTLGHRSSTSKKYNKGSKQTGKTLATADPATILNNLNKELTTTETETIKSTTAKSKSSKLSLKTAVLPSKSVKITKTVGKIAKFNTEQVKRNPEVVIDRIIPGKNSYWSEDFNRNKRLDALKVMPVTVKKRATYEPKYYYRFKKRMKHKLFEKKVTEQVATDRLTEGVNSHNKEVEITIIDFDDLNKMSTSQHFDTFDLSNKDESRPFTDYNDYLVAAYTTLKSEMKTTTEKVDIYMHNELLYKDIFNEQTTSTAPRKYSNIDLTKKTEYDDPLPIKDGQNVISNNKFRNPFEKAPDMFHKMQRGKNLSNPKRVHISSHHYKYDIFYDDVKKTGKNHGVEGLSPELGAETSTTMNLYRKHAPTIWGTKAPHKKRNFFTFRRCKPKSTGGLMEPTVYSEEPVRICEPKSTVGSTETTAYSEEPVRISTGRLTEPTADFEEPVLTSTPGNSSDVSMPKLEEDFPASEENTDTNSLVRSIKPLTDIEDLVTLLDIQDLGESNSNIDSDVTLAAIRTEFFTGITVRENVRRAEAATALVTTATPATTTTPGTTAATATITTATATTTTASATVPSSPLPGSLTNNLTNLKKTTSSRKSSKDKEKQLGSQSDRQRRLFKFSDLQYHLKSFMKNLTMTTKRANVTTPEKAATGKEKATRMERADTTEQISDEKEGFHVTYQYGPIPHASPETLASPEMLASPETLAPPITFTPTGETSVTTPEINPDALPNKEEESTYNLEGTQKDQTTTSLLDHQHYWTQYVPIVPSCVHKKPLPESREEVYVEPQTYNDQVYEEAVSSVRPSTPPPCEEKEPAPHCDFKREVQPKTFTAKDVAALEVIVDLMQNTVSYEEHSAANARPTNSNDGHSTNAIQVHIAIPFIFQKGKKRSPSSDPDPVRVRKVFSAKMFTPVDLEYQVHSIEGPKTNDHSTIKLTSTEHSSAETSTCIHCGCSDLGSTNSTDADILTPGMYLLIDKPKDRFALKPVLDKINLSYLKTRQLPSETTASMTEAKLSGSIEETTSLKSLAKVTLSKDMVALINQNLLEFYGNRSRVSKDIHSNNTRVARSVWFRKLKEKKKRKKKGAQKCVVKRRIDWDAVKAYFGHDRVCNCKCKSNTAMCRACAASDAVIDELIFEFDNIGRYMADHCTEIQTFFWMNPIGGQKLKDSVSKIDKSLADYCKRVKGKCQGRLCKTFSTYIDKRNFIKMAKIEEVEDTSCLLSDLDNLAHDLKMAVALNVCYNDKLKENGEKFINLTNNFLNNKSLSKRSNPTTSPKRMVKQVYSLDNINVNIICNPETPSTADELMMAVTIIPQSSSQQIDHLLHFDLEDDKHKKRKGFHLFPRRNKKSKLLSYFDVNKKVKRQVDNQASIPLISDGGGAFWYDYLKAGTNEPRLARRGRLHQKLEKLHPIKDTPTITVDVVQRAVTVGNVLKVTATAEDNDLGINTIYKTVHTRPERNSRKIETTTDSLSQNINQMLQLFGSLQEVESMINNTNLNPITNLPKDPSIHRKVSKDKQKKVSLVHKVKQKVDKALAKNRTKSTTTSKTKKANRKIKLTLEKEMDELTSIEHTIEAVTQQAETTNAMSDGYSDNGVVVISLMTPCKVTANTQTPNNRSTTMRLTKKSTASNNTAISKTVAIKGIAPKGDKKSESTPVVNETSTKFGFKNMIKAVTVMFNKGQTQTKKTPEKTTKISTTTELNTELTPMQTGFIDVVTGNLVNDYVFDENTQNTTENPTILIINDYDSQVSNDSLSDDMKENYKRLLLSIIQFETNNLNEEWDRIAYSGGRHRDHREETDLKRSAPGSPKVETKALTSLSSSSTPKAIILKPKAEAASSEGYQYVSLEPDKATKTPPSLLKQIAKKIGINMVKSKKVVKKASLREARRNRKRANFIRNRKLRLSTYNQETPAPVTKKEACLTRRTTHQPQICDIQATFKHIQSLQTSVPPKIFETLMKNVSCYKYRNADASFIIPWKKRGKTWDWIRNKRSFKHFHNKIKDDHDSDNETHVVGFEDDSTDIFERFVKGDNGIYKIVKRKKRKVNLEALERGLRNIPTLRPTENELYVMVGDSVTLDCGINTPIRTCDGKFHWKTDRKRMLEQDNVEVDGLTVVIHNVEPKNSGTYTCSLDHTVRKNVMLNVMTVPSFDVVFLPLYKTEDNCSYDDLIAIQQLGSLMANETHCGEACSVRIDEPVCQRDRSTNNTMLRATAVISMAARPVNCSLQCKRDIVSSLVMLSAANAAVLASIPVEVSREGVCETLTPWKTCVRPVVTHKLRKKDTNGHQEYHHLSSVMSPRNVNVVVICPAGYYLVNKYKLCSSCPLNTSSKAGDNTCRSCPRGTHAEPGSATCHVVRTPHHRRYDWWWYPPCGYVVACCGVLFGCTACILLSVIVHVVSRDAELPDHDGDNEEQNIHKPIPSVTVAYAHFPGARPLSPSRVILPRFFRPSLTSSRATDSQETKFELWKERNRPPPLPPIDFDP